MHSIGHRYTAHPFCLLARLSSFYSPILSKPASFANTAMPLECVLHPAGSGSPSSLIQVNFHYLKGTTWICANNLGSTSPSGPRKGDILTAPQSQYCSLPHLNLALTCPILSTPLPPSPPSLTFRR